MTVLVTKTDFQEYVETGANPVFSPRVGHHVWDGSAWVNEGLLHESETRTNLLVDSDLLETQTVTVTAVPHTLHFTGTGSVALSGVYSGSLAGVGSGEQNRQYLTFTPTAGSLVVTVTGSVQQAQLEAGSTPSSLIPTSGSTATRAAETLTVAAANLPWPTPKVIGPELVTNGTFDTDTDWTKGADWTIGSGVATKVVGAATNGVSQPISVTAGSVYAISFDVSGYTGGGLSASFTGGTTVTTASASANGSYTFYLTAASGNTTIIFNGGPAFAGSIDNISVREIDPLSVSIQMDGRVTYADTDDYEAYYWRWLLDTNRYLQAALDATSTRTGMPRFFQNDTSYTVAQVAGVDAYSPGVNVPYNIASRHGSTFINGAVSGTALTADTTPTALPDLSSTNLQLAYDYMGTIRTFRMWNKDLGDAGIEEAST